MAEDGEGPGSDRGGPQVLVTIQIFSKYFEKYTDVPTPQVCLGLKYSRSLFPPYCSEDGPTPAAAPTKKPTAPAGIFPRKTKVGRLVALQSLLSVLLQSKLGKPRPALWEQPEENRKNSLLKKETRRKKAAA